MYFRSAYLQVIDSSTSSSVGKEIQETSQDREARQAYVINKCLVCLTYLFYQN